LSDYVWSHVHHGNTRAIAKESFVKPKPYFEVSAGLPQGSERDFFGDLD